MAGPLFGVKVLDLTRFQNGPSATRRLADLGADVIKVEAPTGGDGGRIINMMSDGYPLFFETFNRGKRSVTADLKSEGSRELMHRLVAWCDVLAENFKPGTLQKWGYGYEDLKAINPKMIYASNSGYGE
jgi:CoA:oxalate CoA-transferase